MPLGSYSSIQAIRALIAIAETGSLSKAAARLGVSQPSVSAQVKRLQSSVGGALLKAGANGMTLTEFGEMVLHQARRVVDALDQLTAMSGSGPSDKSLRLGVTSVLLPSLVRTGVLSKIPGLSLFADQCREIQKGLVEGYIDVGCCFASGAGASELEDLAIAKYPVPLGWARSKSFVLSPGKPLPVVGLPGDDYLVRPLQRSACAFRFFLQTADLQAKIETTRAGLGVCAAPLSVIPPDLIVAKEYYLPKLRPLDAYICCRTGFDKHKAGSVIPYLEQILPSVRSPGESDHQPDFGSQLEPPGYRGKQKAANGRSDSGELVDRSD
mgnify:CR=1 FL=1